MEEGFLYSKGHVFIRKCVAHRNYAGAPGGSHLMDTWRTCNSLRVVPRSHERLDCRGGRSEFSGFQAKGYVIKARYKCLSLYLLLTRMQRRHSTVSTECI